MAATVVIAENQTAEDLPVGSIGIPNAIIPASGTVTLTDYADLKEFLEDKELGELLGEGFVLLRVDGVLYTSEESCDFLANYTRRRDWGGASDDEEVGTTSDEKAAASTFTFDSKAGDFVIFWYCEYMSASSTGAVEVEVRLDSSIVLGAISTAPQPQGGWASFSGFCRRTLTQAEHEVQLLFASVEKAVEVRIRRVRIEVEGR